MGKIRGAAAKTTKTVRCWECSSPHEITVVDLGPEARWKCLAGTCGVWNTREGTPPTELGIQMPKLQQRPAPPPATTPTAAPTHRPYRGSAPRSWLTKFFAV